jgi:two-component system KDP operon response regulator KdpE
VAREVPRSVLVVEDEPTLLSLLTDVLRDRGYAPAAARGREEALRQFRPGRFPVVILDLGLPDDPGRALWRLLRAVDPEAFLIAVSGEDAWLQELTRQAPEGVVTLRKPFSVDLLVRTVEQAIAWRARRGDR